jgi:hypothetical protein
MADVFEMNDENLRRMLADSLNLDNGWHIVSIVEGQSQELTESTETQALLYRLMQNLTIYVQRF